MKTVQLIILITVGLVLSACGKDEPSQAANKSAPAASSAPAPAKSAAPMSDPAPSATIAAADGATRYIDHAKDEIEFGLKKSLAGLESLLEDVTDSDEMARIKKDIAGLQSKLDDL